MRNVIFILILLLITTACDQGRIYDHEPDFSRPGMVARVSVATSGSPAWPQGYTLAVAGFENGNDYALISKNVSPEPDGNCSVVLAGIPASASTVELCVIDRLRRRIASFASVEADPMADTIRVDAQGIDISVSNFIQTSIFNTTCIQCHGASGFTAAGLDLTAPGSFSRLIGVSATKVPGALRVAPGNSNESVLYNILSTDASAAWSYDHSVEVVDPKRLELIKNWIDDLHQD